MGREPWGCDDEGGSGLSAARPTNLHDLPTVTHSPPPSAEPPRVSGTPFFRTPLRKLLAVGVAIAAALGGVVAWQWWQEGPLRDAEAALARGQAPRALALAEYYLDLHPGSERAEADRARALSDLGRADEAIEIYKRIGAATIDELRAWARAHMVRSEWSRAAPLLEQSVRLRPADADALYELTTCRTRLGLLTEALESAERFTALPGQGARGNILLGAIQADRSNPDEAILAYQRAEALAPDGLGLQLPPEEFFEQFGTLLLNQGRDAEAIPLFERSLAARPTASTHSLLGKALARTGDIEGARRSWNAAIELDPAGVTPREELANLALVAGDVTAAREWLTPFERLAEQRFESAYLFQRLAALDKDDTAFARWKAKADELRDRQQLIASLEQMMASSPGSYWAQVVRAHKFATLGNRAQAADLINGIKRTDDENPFVTELREAVLGDGPLPALERVPLKQF